LEKLKTYLLGTALALSGLILFLAVTLFIALNSGKLDSFVKQRLTEAFNTEFRSRLEIRSLDLQFPSTIVLYDAALFRAEQEIPDMTASRIDLDMNFLGLMTSELSRLTVRSLRIDTPAMNVWLQENGSTSLEDLFMPASEEQPENQAALERLFIGSLSIANGSLSVFSTDHDKKAPVRITRLTSHIKKLLYAPDVLAAGIERLSLEIPDSNVVLHEASGRFLFSDNQSSVLNLRIRTGNSALDGSFSIRDFNVLRPDTWAEHSSSRIVASVENGEIHTSDLELFWPLQPFRPGTFVLKGRAEGELREVSLRQFILGHKNSLITLDGTLLNLNQPEYLAFRLNSSGSVLSRDLAREFVEDSALAGYLDAIGDIAVTGSIEGDLKEFFSDLDISTAAGTGTLALTMSLPDNSLPSAEALFSLEDFEIYRFTPEDEAAAGILNASGSMQARGDFTRPEQFSLALNIENSFWKEQEIDRGSIAIDYRDNLLEASVELGEKRSRLSLSGNIDWTGNEPLYSAEADLKNIDLSKFTGREEASSDLNCVVTLRGRSFDPDILSAMIKADFERSRINTYDIVPGETVVAEIRRNGKRSTLTIRSSALDFTAEGTYTFRNFSDGLDATLSAFVSEIRRNNVWDRSRLYTSGATVPEAFSAEYRIDIRDISPLAVFLPVQEYKFSGSATGTSSSGNGRMELTGTMEIDEFSKQDELAVRNATLRLDMSNTAASVIGAELAFNSASLEAPDRTLAGIDLRASWANRALDLKLEFQDTLLDQKFSADLNAQRKGDLVELTLNRFRFGTEEEAWTAAPASRADFSADFTRLYDIRLRKNKQSITCGGTLSTSQAGTFSCRVVNLDAAELKALWPSSSLSGILTSSIDVTGPPGTKRTNIELNGREIAIEDIRVGSLRLMLEHTGRQLACSFQSSLPLANGTTINDISGKGSVPLELTYDPFNLNVPDNLPVSISCSSDNLSAEFLELLLPFFRTAEGTIPAELTVRGRTPEPEIFLSTRLDDTAITVEPTEASYRLSGAIDITPEKARIGRMTVVDSLGGKGVISGTAALRELEVTAVDLKASFDRLILFDKPDRRDDSSYGIIKGTSSSVSFAGPVDKPVLSGSLTIDEADFTLYSTAANESSKYVGVEQFIEFVPRFPKEEETAGDGNGPVAEDPEFSYSLLDIVEIRDVRLRGAPDLRYSMIFDRIRGEKLETTLQNLSLVVNKRQQNYELFGSVDVSAGKYYFSNTSFDLDSGGRIVWNNVDIREGVMENLSGRKYVTVTDNETGETDNVRLLIAIEGTLNLPDVQMGYYLNDETQPFASGTTIGSQSSKIDPNAELNTISLLLSKQWYIRPGSKAAGGGLSFSSVGISTGTGLISSQLSRLVQEASGLESFNLNVAVDDEGEFSGLEFSFALVVPGTEGKMRFLGTGFSSSARETELFNYYGNSQRLEYRITPKLFFEAYRSYGLFGNDVTTTNLLEPEETYGISLSYRERFYSWKEFWESIFGGDEN
jgi:hypothetical protein